MILNKSVYSIILTLIISLSCGTQNNTTTTSDNSGVETVDELEESLVLINQPDTIYNDLIKTPLLFNSSFELSQPIINLNTQEQLTLKFDDFSEDLRFFQFNIIKCDKNWNTSNENQMRYLDGFIDNDISNFDYSQNTLRTYTHYSLNFPNYKDYKITQSGNYVIEVFNNEIKVLSKRFQVVEQLCEIKPTVKKASEIMDANYRQEIDFDIETENPIQNPIKNITVHLYKNGNTLDTRKELKPKFVDGNILKYDYDNANVFDGGNEYRALNLKSMRLLLQYVNRVEKEQGNYLVSLYQDEAKTFKTYSFREDLNGKFLIKNEDRPEASHLSAEYLNVAFTLNYKKPLAEGNFYIYGGISNWKIKDEFKLNYNSYQNVFECTTLLKQGFYDYEYIYMKDGIIDEAKVEGTHFATQNEYTIQVFWTDNYGEERLIGHKTFTTHE